MRASTPWARAVMMGVVRRAGTYSIVARDADTLELGVAVQSHWFSVGSVVPWVRAGVGAVAMQSIPVPGGGPRLLELLGGMDAHDALRMLITGDDERDARQFGLVDARGEAAAHYGRGAEIGPDNAELLFWAGLAAVQHGNRDAGLQRVRRAMEANPGWQELLPRLPADLAPAAPAVRQALGL